MLTEDIKQSINDSVLCWLATVDARQVPNVSPKEVFTHYGDDRIIIANIASPKSIINIKANASVCVSFIDVFKEKGFKVVGQASIIERGESSFDSQYKPLYAMAGDTFRIHNIISIAVEKVAPIVAPSYKLFPDISEAEKIQNSMKNYKVKPV